MKAFLRFIEGRNSPPPDTEKVQEVSTFVRKTPGFTTTPSKLPCLQAKIDLLTFDGEEGLSRPFLYTINSPARRGTSASKRCSTSTPGSVRTGRRKTVIRACGSANTSRRTLYGIITGFQRLSESADLTRYSVTLEPRLARPDAASSTGSTRPVGAGDRQKHSPQPPRHGAFQRPFLPGARVPAPRTGDGRTKATWISSIACWPKSASCTASPATRRCAATWWNSTMMKVSSSASSRRTTPSRARATTRTAFGTRKIATR